MSITFTSGLSKPSGVLDKPGSIERPAFDTLYGFDAPQGLGTPVLTVQQVGDDALLTVGSVTGATSYTFKRDGNTIATGSSLTHTDTNVVEAVSYVYTVEVTDGVEVKTSSSVPFIIYADFTNLTLTESNRVQNQLNNFTLTFRPDVVRTAATTITLSGLSGSATASNSSLTIAGTNASLFGSVGDWNNNGTLVLTVASGQTVPNNADTTISFYLTNPTFPNSGTSSVTLASSGFNTTNITGTFFNVTELPPIFNITEEATENDIITTSPTNPSGEVNIRYAEDTDDLYVYDGDWYKFSND